MMGNRVVRAAVLMVVALVVGLSTQIVLAEAEQGGAAGGVVKVGSACHELTSCGACRNTTLCHWCSDEQCHAIGSIHGCVYGTYCYDNHQCERTVPEYRGYASPSIAVLLGVCLVGGTAIFCAMATLSIAREYANQSAEARASAPSMYMAPSAPPAAHSSTTTNRNGYVMLSGDDGDGDEDREAVAAGPEAEAEVGAKKGEKPPAVGQGTAASVGAGARRVRRGRRGGAGTEGAAAAPGPSPLARKVLGFTRIVAGTGIIAALLGCTVVVMFAPHTPGVNVCNTEFDWGSIVNSLKKVRVEADVQILVSIYNPNVLDAEIESGTAVLYHKHLEVGTMVFNPTLLAGGYITDMLLTLAFDGEAWEDAHLGLEYETGTLAFLMDATVSASVLFHGFKTYPFTFSINNYYIKVADAVGYDRSLCNCTQMMQGRRPPPPKPATVTVLPNFAAVGDGTGSDAQGQNALVLPEIGDEGIALK